MRTWVWSPNPHGLTFVIAALRGREGQVPGTPYPGSLAYQVGSKPMKDPVSRKRKRWLDLRNLTSSSGSPRVSMCLNDVPTHKHAHMCTQERKKTLSSLKKYIKKFWVTKKLGNTHYKIMLNETNTWGFFHNIVHKTLESIRVYTEGLGLRLQSPRMVQEKIGFVLTILI